MNDPDDWGDRYVVHIGIWHFGPFPMKEAYAFAADHDGQVDVLWLPDHPFAFSTRSALDEAIHQRAKRQTLA